MFEKLMSILQPVAGIAASITGNPIVGAIAVSLKIIDKVDDATDETRTEMYKDLAVGMGTVSAIIIEALEDGNISKDEHRMIMAALEDLAKELDE